MDPIQTKPSDRRIVYKGMPVSPEIWDEMLACKDCRLEELGTLGLRSDALGIPKACEKHDEILEGLYRADQERRVRGGLT